MKTNRIPFLSVSLSPALLWVWMLPILLLAMGLAIPHMNSDALWTDEVFTHQFAGSGTFRVLNFSPLETILYAAQSDFWPPLAVVLQNIWARLVGDTMFAGRFFHLLIGLLALAMTYRLGARVLDARTGRYAAALLATSALFVYYMHETRGYTLLIFWVACAVWLYSTLMIRSKRWMRYAFPITIALALYTHYIALIFIIGMGAYHLLLRGWRYPDEAARKQWVMVLRLAVNGILIFLPYIGVIIAAILADDSAPRNLSPFVLLQNISAGMTNALPWLTVPMVMYAITQRKQPALRMLLIWLGVSLLLIGIAQLAIQLVSHPRHILPLLLIVVLVMAAALRQLYDAYPALAVGCLLLWMGAGIAYSQSSSFMQQFALAHRPMAIETIHTLQEAVQCVAPDDRMVMNITTYENPGYGTNAIQYYFWDYIGQWEELQYLSEETDASQFTLAPSALDAFIADAPTVWWFQWDAATRPQTTLDFDAYMREAGYQRCDGVHANDASVWYYTQADSCAVVMTDCMP